MEAAIPTMTIEAVARALGVTDDAIKKRTRGEIQDSPYGYATLACQDGLLPILMLVLELIGLGLMLLDLSGPILYRVCFESMFVLRSLFSPKSREDMATLPAAFSGTIDTQGLGHLITLGYIFYSFFDSTLPETRVEKEYYDYYYGGTRTYDSWEVPPRNYYAFIVGLLTYFGGMQFYIKVNHVVDPASFRSLSDARNAEIFCCRHNSAVRGFCWLAVSAANFDYESPFSYVMLILDIYKVVEYAIKELQGGVYVTSQYVYCTAKAIARLGNQWKDGTFEHTAMKKQVVLYKPRYHTIDQFSDDLQLISKINDGALRPSCWALAYGRTDTEALREGNIALMLPARLYRLEENSDLRLEWMGKYWSRRGELDGSAGPAARSAKSSLTWTLHNLETPKGEACV